MTKAESATAPPEHGRVLDAFDRALAREVHNLSRWPELTWQQLYNRLQWEDGGVQGVLDPEGNGRFYQGSVWLRSRAPFRESEALLHVLTGHTGAVYACDVNQDKTLIVSAGADGTVRIWDALTGQARTTLEGDGKEAWCCAFSPDGQRVAAGDTGGTLKVWDLRTEEEVAAPRHDRGGPVTSCEFSPDGSLILFGGSDGLTMWDADRERILWRVDKPEVSACAFHPGSEYVIAGGFDHLEIRDASRGKVIRAFSDPDGYTIGRISRCAYSPDGATVASTDRYDDALRLWDAATGQPRMSLIYGCPILACSWSPDARFVVAALNDQTLRISSTDLGREQVTLEGHAGTVFGCAVDSTGSLLVSSSQDGTLRLWDVNAAIATAGAGTAGEWLAPARLHQDTVLGHDVSPDGSFVVSTSRRGTIAICDAESGEARVVMRETYIGGVESCVVSPDASLIVTAHHDGTLVLWDSQTGEEMTSVHCVRGGILGGVRDCAVSPDGSLIVSANGDGTLKIWDADDLWERHAWRERGEIVVGDHEVHGCSVSPDRSFIVSTCEDTLKIWDPRTRRQLVGLEGHKGPVVDCAASPDGSLVASASGDHTLKIWNAGTRGEAATLEGHSALVTCCAFSPDGKFILSSGQDGTLRLWSIESNSEAAVIVLPGDAAAAVFHPFQPVLFCGGGGGDLYSIEVVGLQYGPIVVTASDKEDGPSIRCPECWTEHPVDDGWLGRVIDCPTPTCDLTLRVNPFITGGRSIQQSP